MHRPEIAAGVVVDNASRIKALHDRLGPQSQRAASIVLPPAVLEAVEHVRVHVVRVRPAEMHGIDDYRRMVGGHASVKRRVVPVAVRPVGLRRLPVVGPGIWHRERNEHADVIGRPHDLFVAQVIAWRAAVVVGVDEVDPKGHQPSHGLLGGVIVGPSRPHLGIVDGRRTSWMRPR